MAKKLKTWNNKSVSIVAPKASVDSSGAIPKSFGNNSTKKWFVCSKTPSRALELILKTALPHYYLESEQQGQNFSVNSWTQVMQDYWDGLSNKKCPRIQDIPGFKLDQSFSQGFSLTFPNATKRHFKNEKTGSGAIVNFSIPPNVSGYVNPWTVDVEVISGSWNGKYYEYDDTVQLSPSWTYHSARQTAPLPDYCLPEPGTNLFNNIHVSKPGLYTDNGTGYPSVGWKGNSNVRMHTDLIAPQFQSNSFPPLNTFIGASSVPGHGKTFGDETWKASLHAQAYYTGRGSYRYESNANNPATYRQYDVLSNESNAVLTVAPGGYNFGINPVGGNQIWHTAQTLQQALLPTNFTDNCSNKPLFSNVNIASHPQANYNEGTAGNADAQLRAFGKDAFNMALNRIDGGQNDAEFSIDGFHHGVFEVTVPHWWTNGWTSGFSNEPSVGYSAVSCHPLYGATLLNANGVPTTQGQQILFANFLLLTSGTNPDNVMWMESRVGAYDDGGYWGNCGYPASGVQWSYNTGRLFSYADNVLQAASGSNKKITYVLGSGNNEINKAKLEDLEGVSWFNSNGECRALTPCEKCLATIYGNNFSDITHKYVGSDKYKI